MYSLEELFCPIDDFCLKFEPAWRKQLIARGKPCRNRQLKLSEVMTIVVAFHQSPNQNFKGFYLEIVSNYWRKAFPRLVTCHRFVEWLPSTIIPLMTYFRTCLGTSTGIGFIDSTSLKVCHMRSGIL